MLQTLYTLSDDQTEYQPRDRLSFMRFAGLGRHDAGPRRQDDLGVPRAADPGGGRRTPVRAVRRGARRRGYLAMGGQIVNATMVEARRARSAGREGHRQGGGVPAGW